MTVQRRRVASRAQRVRDQQHHIMGALRPDATEWERALARRASLAYEALGLHEIDRDQRDLREHAERTLYAVGVALWVQMRAAGRRLHST